MNIHIDLEGSFPSCLACRKIYLSWDSASGTLLKCFRKRLYRSSRKQNNTPMVKLASLRPYLLYIIELHVFALVMELSPANQFDPVFY